MKKLINNGVWLKNEDVCQKQSTIAVTGLGRSGTTMASRILSALDIPMGEKLTPRTNEDKEIQLLLKSKDFEGFSNICEKRNAQWDKWGYKCPALRGSIKNVIHSMRNPRVIILYRDILAISLRNNISVEADIEESLHNSINAYKRMLSVMSELECPILSLSYEKSLTHPEYTVREIAKFCGVELSAAKTQEIVSIIKNGDPQYLKNA